MCYCMYVGFSHESLSLKTLILMCIIEVMNSAVNLHLFIRLYSTTRVLDLLGGSSSEPKE